MTAPPGGDLACVAWRLHCDASDCERRVRTRMIHTTRNAVDAAEAHGAWIGRCTSDMPRFAGTGGSHGQSCQVWTWQGTKSFLMKGYQVLRTHWARGR